MSERPNPQSGDTHTPRWKKITKSGRPARKTVRKIVHENHVCLACNQVFVREAGRGRQYCTPRCWDKGNPRKHEKRRRKFERSKKRRQWKRDYQNAHRPPPKYDPEELRQIRRERWLALAEKGRATLAAKRATGWRPKPAPPWPEWKKKESRLTRALKAADDAKAAKVAALGPHQIKRMRSLILQCVEEQIEQAHAAVMGKDQDGNDAAWTPTQARIFDTLLKKVLPDLNLTAHREESKTKPVAQMSIDELEAAVATARRAKRGIPDADVEIDGTFSLPNPDTHDEDPT